LTAESRPILFSDPAADYRDLSREIDAAINRVLTDGSYICGSAVEEFEREFAGFVGARRAVGTATGTDALCLALRAAGVGPGDEVITAPNTFTATAMAVVLSGARPVFVDVLPDTLNLNPALLEAAITDRARAVIPVHLYGQPADMAEIMDRAEDRGLLVIEDACQAHGAAYKDKSAGTIGRAGAFSFYPTKNLGGIGDGGMLVTDDEETARKVRALANYGASEKDHHEFLGTNSRLDSVQAAVLLVKLGSLEKWNRVRQGHAGIYCGLLGGSELIQLPGLGTGRTHVYHQFVIRVPAEIRDRLRERLGVRGVPTMVHYPAPIHLQPAFSFLELGPGAFPVAEAAAREVLSLPVHQHLAEGQVRRVAETLLEEIDKLSP
jgi:dTDP-4-amino-4,6-dideoxygalactose transaminase